MPSLARTPRSLLYPDQAIMSSLLEKLLQEGTAFAGPKQPPKAIGLPNARSKGLQRLWHQIESARSSRRVISREFT